MIGDGPATSNRGFLDRASDRSGVAAVLAFFSTRVLRGGPRIFLYLAAFIVFLFLATRLFPESVPGNFSNAYFWSWSGKGHGQPIEEIVPGSMRVVVFGENDIATRVNMPGLQDVEQQSWTEALCSEVRKSLPTPPLPSLLAAFNPR